MSSSSSSLFIKCIGKVRDGDFDSKINTDKLSPTNDNLLGLLETGAGNVTKSLKVAKNADWSSLPPELLEKIFKNLTVIIDSLRFPAVCRNWRSAISSPNRPPRHLPCQIPWLMLPSHNEDDIYDEHNVYGGDFFSVSDKKVYHIDLPKARSKRCFGSSHGWLCFVEDKTLSISLLNPLTKAHIQLPPFTTLPDLTRRRSVSKTTGQIEEEFIWIREGYGDHETFDSQYMFDYFLVKCILSDNPTSHDNYIVMVIYSEENNLAFCRVGDSNWSIAMKENDRVSDAILHEGQFYTISLTGNLKVFDVGPNGPKVKKIIEKTDINYISDLSYLVEVAGKLLMVVTRYCGVLRTLWCRVYKFTPSSGEWTGVRSLDDYAVFIGKNCSVSVLVKDVQPKGECKPNCIYFTDHHTFQSLHVGGHGLGIFNLEDNSIEILPCYLKGKPWLWPPPMWIAPSLS